MMTMAATFTLAVAYTFLSQPVYKSEMLMLLEDKSSQTQVLEDAAQQIQLGGGADFTTQINTQLQVLLSRPLVNKAVVRLSKKYPKLKDDDIDDVIKRLEIEQVTRTQVVSVAFKDTDRQLVQDMLKELAKIYIDYSQDVQKSQVSGAITFINAELPRVRMNVEASEEALRDFRSKNNILDPEEQAKALSGVMSDLMEEAEKAKVELQTSRKQYLALASRLGSSPEQALAAATLSEDKIYQDVLKQYQDTETQLALEKTRFRDDYPTVQNLKDKRDSLQKRLNEQAGVLLGGDGKQAESLRDSLAGTLESNRTSSSTADRYGELRVSLAGDLVKAENLYLVQSARVTGLEAAKERLLGKFQLVPGLAKRYQELNRNAVIASDSLNRLLQRLQELEIKAAQELSPWRVIEPAVLPDKEKPVWPKPLVTLGVGSILSVVFGLLVAVLLETFDDRVKTVERAKELMQLPLLGAIPYNDELNTTAKSEKQSKEIAKISKKAKSNGRVQNPPYTRSAYEEAFRSLLTNIRFLNSVKKVNTFVISSSAPGEGKSTVSTNLARIAAELNRKVLIIDADLRRPTVAKRLELTNSRGLSSVLAGNLSWQEAVQKLGENLFVLTSGPIPPNPVSLLDSRKMAELTKQWREEFDLVLIDSPPLIGLTDATLLARHADGILMVIGLETARRGGLKGARERLEAAGVVPMGMIANALKVESEGYYYYYQYYYHYYGEPTPEEQKKPKER